MRGNIGGLLLLGAGVILFWIGFSGRTGAVHTALFGTSAAFPNVPPGGTTTPTGTVAPLG